MILKIKKILRHLAASTSSEREKSQPDTFAPYRVRHLCAPEKNRKRVVHAIANFMTGGSSRLVVDLIEHLGHTYEQEVITSFNPEPPSYTGLLIHEFRQLRSPDNVVSYLRRFRPGLMHIHYWGESDKRWYKQVFLAAEQYGCRVIENINTPVEPYYCDAVDRYVYVSDYVLKTFGRPDEKNLIIYPGSNFDIFAREGMSDIPDNSAGMVYRLEPDKLNEKSIDVFIKVARLRPGTKMIIVGGGTYLDIYKKAASSAGVIDSFDFTGYVSYESLMSFYRRMSVFVAPVWKESFGQVSPFAMNMGIPVVGYDIGALPEIIGDRELLAPPGDSDRLAQIIIRLLDSREKRLSIGAANQKRARGSFSVETMIRGYSGLYQKLFQESR